MSSFFNSLPVPQELSVHDCWLQMYWTPNHLITSNMLSSGWGTISMRVTTLSNKLQV